MWNLKNGLWFDDAFPFFHAVTTKTWGDQRDQGNFAAFCGRLKLDALLFVTAEQIHGKTVEIAGDKDRGRCLRGADGILTSEHGLVLAIYTADCVPVFLGDARHRAAGVVHAGWRGLAAGIIPEAIRLFTKKFGSLPRDITAAIGPHIQKCCYAVGEDVRQLFGPGDDSDRNLDLDAITLRQLVESGVQTVSSCLHCTSHESEAFFSYRRDKTEQRMISLVSINDRSMCDEIEQPPPQDRRT